MNGAKLSAVTFIFRKVISQCSSIWPECSRTNSRRFMPCISQIICFILKVLADKKFLSESRPCASDSALSTTLSAHSLQLDQTAERVALRFPASLVKCLRKRLARTITLERSSPSSPSWPIMADHGQVWLAIQLVFSGYK
jgi:hypothetical protein